MTQAAQSTAPVARVAYGGRERSKLGGRPHIFDVVEIVGPWVIVADPGFAGRRHVHRSCIDDPSHNGVSWFPDPLAGP